MNIPWSLQRHGEAWALVNTGDDDITDVTMTADGPVAVQGKHNWSSTSSVIEAGRGVSFPAQVAPGSERTPPTLRVQWEGGDVSLDFPVEPVGD